MFILFWFSLARHGNMEEHFLDCLPTPAVYCNKLQGNKKVLNICGFNILSMASATCVSMGTLPVSIHGRMVKNLVFIVCDGSRNSKHCSRSLAQAQGKVVPAEGFDHISLQTHADILVWRILSLIKCMFSVPISLFLVCLLELVYRPSPMQKCSSTSTLSSASYRGRVGCCRSPEGGTFVKGHWGWDIWCSSSHWGSKWIHSLT